MMVTQATTSANPRKSRNIVLRRIDCEMVADALGVELMKRVESDASRAALRCEERIVPLFLAHRGQGTVAAGEDRVPGQGEDLLDVVPVLVREMGWAPPDRAGEEGIADHGQGIAQAGDVKGGLPRRMAPGGERL